MRVSGESGNAGVEAAEEFLESPDKLIVEENFLPEQIFNMAEMTLFWKWMSGRSFIHKEAKTIQGFKAFKDRMTALFGGNAAGYTLEPSVLWLSDSPRAAPHISEHTGLVYSLQGQGEVTMTQLLFQPRPPELLWQRNGEGLLEANSPLRFCLSWITLPTFCFC